MSGPPRLGRPFALLRTPGLMIGFRFMRKIYFFYYFRDFLNFSGVGGNDG